MDNVPPVTMYDSSAQRREAQPKIAYTVREAVQASGLSRSTLYVAIGSGTLPARKCGSRTVILETDLRRYLRSLPRMSKTARSPKGY